jgi:drug/metabolite transporter (DMT)-like permease
MSFLALSAVLLGAFLHAAWNALIKRGTDTYLDTVLVAVGAGVAGCVLMPFAPLPALASWPHIALSTAIHVAYFFLVAAAYRVGDLSHAYPLMRGAAPLIVALLSGVLVDEQLSAMAWLGVSLICGGILGLVFFRATGSAPSRRATAFALLNAVVIAAYTFNDGIGVRLSGTALGYNAWLFALTAMPMAFFAMARRGKGFAMAMKERWPVALIGGVSSAASYSLALWAMTLAPIAIVAALRETSILFGILIAWLMLGEKPGLSRLAAAAGMLCGVAALRLA